jgi:uncharacterized protein YlxW (UPF0749 family)
MIFLLGILLKIKAALLMALQFCIDNWKIVIPIILVLFVWYKYNAQVAQTEKANEALKKQQALVVSVVESLQETTNALKNQTLQVKKWQEHSANAQKATEKALLEARKANALDAPKIKAVESHIKLISPDSCETAIETIKKEMK